jgi:hypothetical protein
MVESATVSAAGTSGYRSLFGSLRVHFRALAAGHRLLFRQEIGEILAANRTAAKWLGIAAGLVFLGAISLVFFLIALLALVPREWLGVAVLALATGVAVALIVAGVRARNLGMFFGALLGGVALVVIGALAYFFLPQLVLAALLVMLFLFSAAGGVGYAGYAKLELRGPERSIRSVKETITWVKASLLGRSET